MPSMSRDSGSRPQGQVQSTAVDYYHLANLANRSYQAAEAYGELLAYFNDTYTADPDLCDAEGTATEADQEVIALRDEFIEYCKTTAGRYELAGGQLEQALRDYMDSDDQAAADIEAALNDWTPHGYGSSNPSWDEADYAGATERPAEATETSPGSIAYDDELTAEGA